MDILNIVKIILDEWVRAMALRDGLTHLLVDFINKNSDVEDVQWDRRMSPRLLFNPYSEKYEDKKIIAHYFLMAAAILDEAVVGYQKTHACY
jgi:hypothetical protein